MAFVRIQASDPDTGEEYYLSGNVDDDVSVTPCEGAELNFPEEGFLRSDIQLTNVRLHRSTKAPRYEFTVGLKHGKNRFEVEVEASGYKLTIVGQGVYNGGLPALVFYGDDGPEDTFMREHVMYVVKGQKVG